jgi:predicted nucleic acid-binding Zn ribbon protein
MPLYTFKNTKTGKTFTDMMSIAEMEEYLEKNKHIKQQLTSLNIVGGVSGMSYRTDSGWKEVQSKIAEAHPNSPLGQQHRKRSIKEVKTEQAIKKYKARRSAKNK